MAKPRQRRGTATLLALVCLAAAPSAGVIVVDWNGGGDFTKVQAAVHAAVECDTILTKPIPCSLCTLIEDCHLTGSVGSGDAPFDFGVREVVPGDSRRSEYYRYPFSFRLPPGELPEAARLELVEGGRHEYRRTYVLALRAMAEAQRR